MRSMESESLSVDDIKVERRLFIRCVKFKIAIGRTYVGTPAALDRLFILKPEEKRCDSVVGHKTRADLTSPFPSASLL